MELVEYWLSRFGNYLLGILVGIDYTMNAVLRGKPQETMSSVAYRKHRDGAFWGFLEPIINTLFWFQPEHCQKAYLADRSRVLPN